VLIDRPLADLTPCLTKSGRKGSSEAVAPKPEPLDECRGPQAAHYCHPPTKRPAIFC
jgi:hypothetical protein